MEREQLSLRAIMFTDIVGYTSLTESDEHLALELLQEHRKIVRSLISVHNGREVKTIGDAFLVEFTSAIEATNCAFEIQQSLKKMNAGRAPKEKIVLRIGIHLGDVVHSNHDVYGDAVNIASRIQRLSEAGGICISRQLFESVRNKLRTFKFESLGAKELKNVASPIEVFKVTMPEGGETEYSPFDGGFPRNRIAVLPFVNISSEKSDEFFADGLTEELISRLSQTKDLRVIARTSAMNYKDNKEKKIREIGRELGAGTVIEGSVRKAGNKVRVSVQVINSENEEHLWSSTYDRNLDDIFEIQSDIASKVADSFSSNLSPLIGKEDLAQHERRETEDVAAYIYFLRGRHLLHNENLASVKQAMEFFNQAIKEDPLFARAYVGRAECYAHLSGLAALPHVEGAKKAEDEIKKALQLDPDLAEAHAILSLIKYMLDDFSASEEEARKAIQLNPSHADAYHALGHLEMIHGKIEEGTKLFEIAYKLDPLKENNVSMLGQVYLYSGREEEAMKLWSRTEHLFPQASYGGMVDYYLIEGDYSKASQMLDKFRVFEGNESQETIRFEGMIAALQGDKEKASQSIARIERTSGKGTIATSSIGLIYYALGDMDKFFEYMDRSLESHSLPVQMLRNSPLFANARKDPRYRKLLEKEGLAVNLP